MSARTNARMGSNPTSGLPDEPATSPGLVRLGRCSGGETASTATTRPDCEAAGGVWSDDTGGFGASGFRSGTSDEPIPFDEGEGAADRDDGGNSDAD